MIAAADPVNLHGITDEAPRAPAPNRRLAFRNGVAVAARSGEAIEWLAEVAVADQRHAAALLDERAAPQPQRGRAWSR